MTIYVKVIHQDKQEVYMMDITETLDECAKHLALREELTIAYSGESNKGENLESSQMIRDVVEFAREQDKTLEKAMVRGTGKTTSEPSSVHLQCWSTLWGLLTAQKTPYASWSRSPLADCSSGRQSLDRR